MPRLSARASCGARVHAHQLAEGYDHEGEPGKGGEVVA